MERVGPMLSNFRNDSDEEASDLKNGWNPPIERWMLDIQRDSANMYCMCIEWAGKLRIYKWICLGSYMLLSLLGAAATVYINAAKHNNVLWVSVCVGILLLLGPTLFGLMEAFSFNGWIQDCKDFGGDFNILGQRIEAQKRLPRNKRQPGIRFSNAASIRFEELKKDAPHIPSWIRKKYDMRTHTASVVTMPTEVLGVAAGGWDIGDPMEGEEIPEEVVVELYSTQPKPRGASPKALSSKDNNNNNVAVADKCLQQSASLSDSNSGVGLQELFQTRLQLIEEDKVDEDALTAYEAYVRQQYIQPGWFTPRATVAGITRTRTRDPDRIRRRIRRKPKGTHPSQ